MQHQGIIKLIYSFTFFLFYNQVFAQSEIIDKKTKSGREYSLRIKTVTADSIFYKHGEKVESIALVDVISLV
ncbi:MAG TPA: hypothetical protein PK289_09725 [Bacteroidia bacterium]|jgi:hypothetical protein|nr:hypothetical protein [Bacteroidia bacterium]